MNRLSLFIARLNNHELESDAFKNCLLILTASLTAVLHYMHNDLFTQPLIGALSVNLFWGFNGILFITYYFISNKKLRRWITEAIFVLLTLNSLFMVITYPSIIFNVISLFTLGYLSCLFFSHYKHLIYLSSILLIALFIGSWLGTDWILISSLIIISIFSFIGSHFRRLVKQHSLEYNTLVNNTSQLIAEFTKPGNCQIIKKGFLGSLESNDINCRQLIQKAFENINLHLNTEIDCVFNNLESRSFDLEIEWKGNAFSLNTSVVPIIVHNRVVKVLFIATPNLVVSGKAQEENFEEELNLQLRLNCFRKDLQSKASNIRFSFESDYKILLSNTNNSINTILDHLLDLFLKESNSGSGILEIGCIARRAAYFVALEFQWNNSAGTLSLPQKLLKTFNLVNGKIFLNSDHMGTNTIRCFFPISESQPGKGITIKNVSSMKDLDFLHDLNDSLARLLENNQFSIDHLTRELAVSRMQLHRKVKSYLGVSPGYLFQLMRMKRAQELLKSGEIRVADVAYALGYCDQSHFSKAFRSWFGYPPVEYLKMSAA